MAGQKRQSKSERQAKKLAELSPAERLAFAAEKIEAISHWIFEVIHLSEMNRIVTYSNTLSAQIPTSYAGNSYHLFQSTLHSYEILRLCALWDAPDDDTYSIMEVVEAVDDPAVLDEICNRVRGWHRSEDQVHFVGPPEYPGQRELYQEIDQRFGNEQAEKARRSIQRTVRAARRVFQSDQLRALQIERDKRMAHTLSVSRKEKTRPVPLKYGFERWALRRSTMIVQMFYLWITGTSFNIGEDSHEIARTYAEDLWHNCTFTIPDLTPDVPPVEG